MRRRGTSASLSTARRAPRDVLCAATPPAHVDARRQALRPRHRQGRRRQDDRLRGRGARARGQGQARARRDVQRQGAPERDARRPRPSARRRRRSRATSGRSTWSPRRRSRSTASLVLHSRALYKTLFDNRYVRTFLRAVPGMQEWAMLGKAWWHTTEKLPDGSFKYDVVILDAPATGHGLDMLRVPKVILDVVPPGLLRRDAERAWALFQDPTTCAIVLVTLPEEMPTTETIELARALARAGAAHRARRRQRRAAAALLARGARGARGLWRRSTSRARATRRSRPRATARRASACRPRAWTACRASCRSRRRFFRCSSRTRRGPRPSGSSPSACDPPPERVTHPVPDFM